MAEHRGEHILITNYLSPANRGDAAILEGLLHALRACAPNASFVVHSSFPDLVPLVHGVEARHDLCRWMPPPITQVSAAYLATWARAKRTGVELPLPNKALRQTLLDYVNADIIVARGGGYLHDYYGDCMPRLWSLRIASILGKNICLSAQSIGPFRDPAVRRLARRVLNDVDLIIARDTSSIEVLRSLQLHGPRIEQTADTAFAMPTKPSHRRSIPRWETTPAADTDRLITLSVRRLNSLNEEEEERYIASFAALVDWAADSMERRSLFISTCTSLGGYHTDDRLFAMRIAARCRSNPKIASLDYDAYEIVDILSRHSVLHVGTRMHSNVLALLAGVPIVGIAYEPKITGLAEAFGLQEFVIGIEDLSPEILIGKVQRALENRQVLADQITAVLPEARASAMDNARMIREIYQARQESKT